MINLIFQGSLYRVDLELSDDTIFDKISPVFPLSKTWLKTGYFVCDTMAASIS